LKRGFRSAKIGDDLHPTLVSFAPQKTFANLKKHGGHLRHRAVQNCRLCRVLSGNHRAKRANANAKGARQTWVALLQNAQEKLNGGQDVSLFLGLAARSAQRLFFLFGFLFGKLSFLFFNGSLRKILFPYFVALRI
jgi:hypothetical protein